MNKNIAKFIYKNTIKEYNQDILVYLKSSNTKSTNYDSYRDIGFVETYQNPIVVKAKIKQVSGSSLVVREIGLSSSGAIYAFVNKQDSELLKIASKIEYNNEFYSVYNKALGDRFLVTDLDFNISKVLLFKMGNQNG